MKELKYFSGTSPLSMRVSNSTTPEDEGQDGGSPLGASQMQRQASGEVRAPLQDCAASQHWGCSRPFQLFTSIETSPVLPGCCSARG